MELKIDPKFPHHYLICIGIQDLYSSNPGKIILKYNPIHFTNEDVYKVSKAIVLSKDKLFKTKIEDSLAIHDESKLVHTVNSLLCSARANGCTIHHFSTEIEVDDSWFEAFVELANIKDSRTLRLLVDARIH